MRISRKYLIIITIICISVIVLAFKFLDAGTGLITIKGRVFSNGKPLNNEIVKIVFHNSGKKLSNLDIQQVRTDNNGQYSISYEWWTPCPASAYTNCEGLSRNDCLHKNAKLNNPDSVGFVVGFKEIKIYNPYWEVSRKQGPDTLFLDLNF